MADKRKLDDMLRGVAGQGRDPKFTSPVSPSGQYYAFVAKVEPLDEAQTDVLIMLDMMTYEWTTNAAPNTRRAIKAPAPLAPPTLFTIASVRLDRLQAVLGVTDRDYVAEGSWYYVTLEKGGDGPLAGELIDGFYPDDDGTQSYGTYTLTAGQLLLLPEQRKDFTTTLVQPPAGALAGAPLITVPPRVLRLFLRIGAWFGPVLSMTAPAAPAAPTAPTAPRLTAPGPTVPPPPPPIVAIGVMDVGAAGCNILFKQSAVVANTLEPFLYLDVGKPINRWARTGPANLKPQAGVASGPIQQNTSNTLRIVLTHWDYDHWAITKGRVAPGGPRLLTTLPITYPQQHYGPTPAQIAAQFSQPARFPAGLSSLVTPEFTLYVVQVVTRNKAESMNNTGLAMLVPLQFPVGAPAAHHCLLPGDASIGNIHPTMPRTDITVYGAVHHGAALFGADQNLPTAAVPPGSVVFSYGISTTTNEHGYGHPFARALTANQAVLFTNMFATAETTVTVGTTRARRGVRGNALIGTQWPLRACALYQNTIFATFTKAVT